MTMETMREFEARLKLVQSRTRVRAQRVYVPTEADAHAGPPAPRATWPVPIIATVVGLALLAGLVAVARNDIARLLPAPEGAQRISFLSSEISDTLPK